MGGTIATVESAEGVRYEGEVIELRPDAILLRLEHALTFRASVAVEVAGVRVNGEVVQAKADALAITFPVVSEIFDAIETVDLEKDEPDTRASPEVLSAIDQALELYEISELPVISDDIEPVEVSEVPAVRKIPRYPTLEPDGKTVAFASVAQYRAQREQNLDHGALVVQADPLELGATRVLMLHIPGVAPFEVLATVAYCEEALVGFTVRPVARRARAAQLVKEEVVSFKGPVDIEAFLSPDVSDSTVYLDVLRRWLAETVEGVVEISLDVGRIELWVSGGRVVFAARQPVEDADRIGRRLAAHRFVSRRTVEDSLGQLSGTQGLGMFMIENGQLAPSVLHRALREQMMDRALLPVLSDGGTARLSRWKDPTFNGQLVPLSRGTLLAQLVRRVIRRTSPSQMRDVLLPREAQHITFDLTKVEPSFRLTMGEFRALQHFAGAPVVAGTFLRSGGLRYRDAAIVLLMGLVLGYAVLE